MNSPNKTEKLLDPAQALDDYFNCLLGTSDTPSANALSNKRLGDELSTTSTHLKFQVAGLRLAIPLNKVHAVLPWPAQLDSSLGNPTWFLGKTWIESRALQVVDTARLIIPKSRQDALLARPQSKMGHVVVIGDGRWGLGCDEIFGQIQLLPTQIKWRSAQGTRPWLSGTLAEERCALLDIDTMVELLDGREWPA